jgi:hypothetical protein
MSDDAASRLVEIRRRVADAETAAGRPAGSVRLIAVCKLFGACAIRPLIDAGHRDFGENRVQEAVRKWPALREAHPDLRLHLIGPLQSNKVVEAVRLFDVIHSVDRDKIAAAIAAETAKQSRSPDLLVQVNTGGEPQKAGVNPEQAAIFVDRCRSVHGLVIGGLMAIPPVDEPPGPHFALLAKLAEVAGVPRLSMGMSGDFELAIAFGATDIRVGEAILGPRPESGGIG